MATWLFPGQGSQAKGMGRGLFAAFPELVRQADAVLGYSVERLCLEDPERRLGLTQFTQPAIFVVSALAFLEKVRSGSARPDRVAGHSLGEYVALFAAGSFDFETGVRLVQKRGELMSRATGGGMAAVVGVGEEAVGDLVRSSGIASVTVANFNAPSQCVVAGPRPDVLRFGEHVERAGATCIPLDVSGAFHSSSMAGAAAEFAEWLGGIRLSDPALTVISNVHARPYGRGELVETLVAQMTRPVRWTESIRRLAADGEREFVEVGPGKVLTKLVQAILRETPAGAVSPAAPGSSAPAPVPAPAPPARAAEEGASRGDAAVLVARSRPSSADPARRRISAEGLGDAQFKRDHGLRYAYVTGSMYRGVSSVELVVRVARAGMLGFFGSGGLPLAQVDRAIMAIRDRLHRGEPWGANLVHQPDDPAAEDALVDLLLRRDVRVVEASAFMRITPALVRFRAAGLRARGGEVEVVSRVLAKVSRPELADAFLAPAPPALVARLAAQGAITGEQARLLEAVPMADDLCAESDSGGHTDGAVAYALTPTLLRLRDEARRRHGYARRVRVGAAGGIGTPEAAAAALMLGAEFLLTGSINQCTVEAGTSDASKDLLQDMDVQDTEYAPAGDMFELGAKVQVLRRGLFFPARANRLYELYRLHDGLDALDPGTRTQLEERYFRRTLEQVYDDVRAHHPAQEIEKAERNPKHKMALVFRWYFARASRLALEGSEESKVDYQIPCGPALGAFNRWVKGTALERWRDRHVDEIGLRLLSEAAALLDRRFDELHGAAPERAPAASALDAA